MSEEPRTEAGKRLAEVFVEVLGPVPVPAVAEALTAWVREQIRKVEDEAADTERTLAIDELRRSGGRDLDPRLHGDRAAPDRASPRAADFPPRGPAR